jgi:hypothetical protein
MEQLGIVSGEGQQCERAKLFTPPLLPDTLLDLFLPLLSHIMTVTRSKNTKDVNTASLTVL